MASNPISQLIERLPAPLRNKYFLVVAAFFFFMTFIDRHDLLTQFRLQRTVDKLEQERDFYQEKIQEAQEERLDMEVNQERFARETYFMQKSDEDVFIIVEE